MDIRTNRQLKSVAIWKQNNYKGHHIWATGVGKSFMITYKDGFIVTYLKDYPKAICWVIVPSQQIKYQITEELKKIPSIIKNVKIFTISECINMHLENIHIDLLIVDEVDSNTSPIRRSIINGDTIKYKHYLGITATKFLIQQYYPKLFKMFPILDTISIKEATDLGFITKSVEYNIGLNLPDKDLEKYKNYTKTIAQGINKFTKLYEYVPYINYNHKKENVTTTGFYAMQVILNACKNGAFFKSSETSKGRWYDNNAWITKLATINGYRKNLNKSNPFDNAIISQYSPSIIKGFVWKLSDALTKRDGLIKTHKLKYIAVYELLKSMDWKETIIFSESSKFCNILHRYLNFKEKKDIAVIYHSKVKIPMRNKKTNEILRYKNGNKKGTIRYMGLNPRKGKLSTLMEYNLNKLNTHSKILCTVKSLSRGFNRPSIEAAITTSYVNSKTTYLQNRGRPVRLNGSDIDIIIPIINIYFKDTIEERKLQNNQKTIKSDVEIHWINDLKLKKEKYV